MNKYLDKLLEKSIENGWYDGYTIDTDASEIQKVLLEFGKQCFEAGITCFEENNELEYSNFEDYLETLSK